MEEKRINAQEGIDIITAMVEATKNRLSISDGNVLLLWGYLTVAVSVAIWVFIPLFIVSFAAMFIVPGHILSRKAKRILRSRARSVV